MSFTKICILGGDARQTCAADVLAEKGFETAVYGLDYSYNRFGFGLPAENITRCAALEDAVNGSAAVILPLPYSIDGIRLNCPLGGYDIRLEKLFTMFHGGELVAGGRLDQQAAALAERAGVRIIDYYAREELAIANTVPTAEGAVSAAMNELPVTISGSKMLVCGCGRVARMLAVTLGALKASVTVAARKPEDLVWARINGFEPHYIYDKPEGGYTAVFNTVPAPVLTREMLSCFGQDTLIIELASKPGGIDMQAASELGLRVIWALSLPGKVAPVTAGRATGECVYAILSENGVTP